MKLLAVSLAIFASSAEAFVAPAGLLKVAGSNTARFGILDENTVIGARVMPKEVSEGQVRSLFYLWNDALATGDSRLVAKRYAKDAMLLPTVSDEPRTDYDGIKAYFDKFLQSKPQGIITFGKVKIGECGTYCTDTGIYEFTMGATGDKVKARYSYVYTYEDGQWKIAHHHSSMMPEGMIPQAPKERITVDQVRNLFYLWNDALDTLDSDCVARRYSKNAVLLPTVSDKPRTDYDSIKDYFDNFLKLKPQGVIVDSFVTVGDGWAKDVGIYVSWLGVKFLPGSFSICRPHFLTYD